MFNNNKLHLIPPILSDYSNTLLNSRNTQEVRALTAQRFEVVKEYCDHILGVYYKQLNEQEASKRTKKRA